MAKVRSIASAPAKPKFNAAELVLRDIYDTAKAHADGGIVLFYVAGDFVTYFEDAKKIGRALGVIPGASPVSNALILGLESSHIQDVIRRVRLAGHKDIWIWNRAEGVKPVI